MGREVVVLSKKSGKVGPVAGGGTLAAADEKKEKRKTRQAKAGLVFGVNKAHKLIASKWRGKVSTDAAVTLAATLQHIGTRLLTDAGVAADIGIAPVKDGETQPHRKVTSAYLQIALTNNAWLSPYIAKGRVVGSAPSTAIPADTKDDDEDNESSESSSSSSGSASE